MRKKVISLVLSVLLVVATSLSAFATPAKTYEGLEIKSENTEAIEGGQLTTTVLKGTQADLDRLIKKAKKEKKGLSKINPQFGSDTGSDIVSSMFSVTGNLSGKANQCFANAAYQKCVSATIKANLNWGGATGFTVWGSNANVLVKGTGTLTRSDPATNPRIQVTVYGMVGGSSVVVQTYDFNPGFSSGISSVYNFDETKYGIIAYINVKVGGDFKYKYGGTNYSFTHWADIVED